MRILVVTGRIMEEEVRRLSKIYGFDVYVADVDVAAFITPSHLRDLDLSGYDLVIVPGMARGDWKRLEEEKGVKIRLGPVSVYDLPLVLENIDKIELSHDTPACKLLGDLAVKRIVDDVESSGVCKFRVGEVEIGGRMKIVAEIVDATEMDRDELVERAEYYMESGADIVDIGVPLEYDPDSVRRAVKVLRDICGALSVDTFSRKAIEIAIEGGVDMIMSISKENVECVDLLNEDLAVVVVGRDLGTLRRLIDVVRERTEKVIADPILDPPLRTAASIGRYIRFREMDEYTPLLFGVGNVTELTDADSIGINALMAFIAEEIGVDLLFTTEASDKTRGSVLELRIASYMAKAAKIRRSPPKDLGINLLVVKEKRRIRRKDPEVYVRARESKSFVRDPKGDFRIWLSENWIVCEHERATIVGKRAKEILDTVIAMGLVSRLDHAGYLGRELMKAEIAFRSGKNYVQDEEVLYEVRRFDSVCPPAGSVRSCKSKSG